MITERGDVLLRDSVCFQSLIAYCIIEFLLRYELMKSQFQAKMDSILAEGDGWKGAVSAVSRLWTRLYKPMVVVNRGLCLLSAVFHIVYTCQSQCLIGVCVCYRPSLKLGILAEVDGQRSLCMLSAVSHIVYTG